MTEPMTPERLAEIRANMARYQLFSAREGEDLLAEVDRLQGIEYASAKWQERAEAAERVEEKCRCAGTDSFAHMLLRRAAIDRRDLLAERDRLQAQVADAWDEGWGAAGEEFMIGLTAAAEGRDLGPQGDGPPNPYRAVLASGDEVQP